VVIRNVIVRSRDANAIQGRWPQRATIEHVEVECLSSPNKTTGISSGALHVRYTEVHGCEDNIWVSSSSTYEYNYLHSNANTGHPDGMQAPRAEGVVIRRNWIDVPAGGNSAIILKTDFGPISGVTVQENYLNGGNFTVYVRNGGHGNPTNVRLLNNRFGRDYRFGLFSLDGSVQQQNNIWHDTGRPTS
jgi:hypothetical protein